MGHLHGACVKSVMLCVSETWAVKKDDVHRARQTEMRLCSTPLNNRPGKRSITSGKLREKMGVECINLLIRRGRHRWNGHVERMDDSDWVKS